MRVGRELGNKHADRPLLQWFSVFMWFQTKCVAWVVSAMLFPLDPRGLDRSDKTACVFKTCIWRQRTFFLINFRFQCGNHWSSQVYCEWDVQHIKLGFLSLSLCYGVGLASIFCLVSFHMLIARLCFVLFSRWMVLFLYSLFRSKWFVGIAECLIAFSGIDIQCYALVYVVFKCLNVWLSVWLRR